jgi:hypothetical protein
MTAAKPLRDGAYDPWRRVTAVADGVGPRAGRLRVLTLACGHAMAQGFKTAQPPRKVRCVDCGDLQPRYAR